MRLLALLFLGFSLFSCSQEAVQADTTMYFPPINASNWETMTMDEAGFNAANLDDLLAYLELKGTKGFMILKNGKIVLENYFNGHSQNSYWYWASAGKTLTALTVGIAQEEAYLDINNKTSDYLGLAWTDETNEQENAITIKHQLTMTTGLNDFFFYCTDPSCLHFKAPAGNRWAYHNAPYTLLQSVVSQAVSGNFKTYFNEKIRDKIGMNGSWISSGYNSVYWSTTRSMARFGLLIANEAVWDQTPVLSDQNYYQEMLHSSQDLNASYGYLWWLNGKDSFMLPSTQEVFNGSIIPNAPSDLVAALGANDQKLYIVPSENLVIVRMGESAEEDALSVSSFDNVLWQKISAVINN